MLTFAQDIDDVLNEKVLVESPVYMPIIGVSSGVLNFYGDVRNNFVNPVMGDLAYKINISAFIDHQKYYKANFFLMYGQLSADQRSFTDISQNLNFRTDLIDIGINLEYGFSHFFKKQKNIKPFISLGLGNIQYTPKADLMDSDGNIYNYWKDGTIRNIDQNDPGSNLANIIYRDFAYETDLRQKEKNEGFGNYSQSAFTVPVDLGFDFRISDRVSCRLGTSMNLTSTDFLDNVSSKGTSMAGKKGNDSFTFTYFSFNFDLFSQPKTVIIEKMFAEMDIDDVMYDDEDGDYIMDPIDNCPGTPYGVEVDTSGCPFDSDKDGIPDYLDKEPNSRDGVWVDANGVTVSEEDFLKHLLERSDAMNRADVLGYFETIGKGYVRKVVTEIPDKFKKIDINADGYIDFDELLKAIDSYFDFKLNFTVLDIYELNNFFFEQ